MCRALNTFVGWCECGRLVRVAEKVLTLCMPVTTKLKPTTDTYAMCVICTRVLGLPGVTRPFVNPQPPKNETSTK